MHGDDMTTGTNWTTLLNGGVLLLFGVLAGCGTSLPSLDEAQTALEAGNNAAALSNVEEALRQDSTSTEAYLLKADILRQRADSGMAPDTYKEFHRRAWEAEEKALSFDSDLRDEVQSRRQDVYEREMSRAELAYNRANKNERDDKYRLAVSYVGAAGIAQADSAQPVLNEAFARLRMGEREAVVPVLETYVQRADTPSVKAYKMLGQLHLGNQNRKAVDLLDQATRIHPDNQELQALRLNAYNRAGLVDRALEAYREQIEKHPSNATYRYNYGALLLEAERYGAAIAQLDSAVALRPAHRGSQYNLGAAYVNAALARDDSIAALEEGTASPSSDTVSTEEQIERLAQKRDQFLEKAIPPLERARKMRGTGEPVRRDACRALMVAYVQTGRPNRAAQVESCTEFSTPDP